MSASKILEISFEEGVSLSEPAKDFEGTINVTIFFGCFLSVGAEPASSSSLLPSELLSPSSDCLFLSASFFSAKSNSISFLLVCFIIIIIRSD